MKDVAIMSCFFMTPQEFEENIEHVVKNYLSPQIEKAADDGLTAAVVIEALLYSAYATLDSTAQDNRCDIPAAFRQLADNIANRYER